MLQIDIENPEKFRRCAEYPDSPIYLYSSNYILFDILEVNGSEN